MVAVVVRAGWLVSLLGLAAAFGCGGSSKRHVGGEAAGTGGNVSAGAAGGTGGTGHEAGRGAAGSGGGSGSGGSAGKGSDRPGRGGEGGGGRAADPPGRAGEGGGGPSSDECVVGSPCQPEGATCVPAVAGVCCVTRLVCEGARWAEGPLECGSTECPERMPVPGTPCGPCAVNCSFDTCTSDGAGQNLEAHCDGTSWVLFELGCLTCCEDDNDCAPGFCAQSACHAFDHGPGCFRDEECAAEEVCSGARSCACGSPTQCDGETAGTCVPADRGCCVENGDCEDGNVCVAGRCKLAAEGDSGDGSCWTHLECDSWPDGCQAPAPVVCPCGMSCPDEDVKGRCVIPL